MKNTFLFSLLITGLVATGCSKSTRTSTATDDAARTDTSAAATATTTAPTTTDTLGAKVDRATDRMADATRDAADATRDAASRVAASTREAGRDLSARFHEWRLNTSDIEADVTAGRPVVRTSSATGTSMVKVDKGNLEKTIKGKLQAEPKLADLKFDVNANAKGEVNLEGKARTTEQIAAAMATALDTEGVMQVTSKIKLDPDAGPNRR